jgi:orotate phosphoribosyltransferase
VYFRNVLKMNSINKKLTQKENLLNLLKAGGLAFSNEDTPFFAYTSGQIGPYYIQSIAIEKNGESYTKAIHSIIQIIQENKISFDVISGGETRDWDFSNPAAAFIKKPHLKIYKTGKTLGADVKGKRVLHIADLNNEGSSIKDYWKPIIEKKGGKLIGLVSFVDRLEDGYQLLTKMGLLVKSVIPLNQKAWQIVFDNHYISQNTHEELLKRIKNKRQWAETTLLHHPEYFRKLCYNPETKQRALKVLDIYPSIKPELENIMKQKDNK